MTAIMLKHVSILPSQIDPPCQALGIPIPPGGWTPLMDPDISDDARGPVFIKWVSSYFKHGDLSSRDFSQLKLRAGEGETSKKPTTDTIPLDELLNITDIGPGAKCEVFLIDSGQFFSAFIKQTTKALFDPQIRKNWGGHPVWFVYCEASFWNVHYAVWNLEKNDKASEINFKSVPGANHFVRRFF
jgi:hypothetical protein